MAHPRISAKLPPDIDPTKAPVAFGRRGLPKLNEELQDPELLTRQRALMALCDLVHDPENAYQAIDLGFLDNLKKLLLDKDGTVRQKTTEVLYIMATHSIGRMNFIEHGVIPALAQLLNDPVDICRWNMHYSLKLVAETPTEFLRCTALSLNDTSGKAGLAPGATFCKVLCLGISLPQTVADPLQPLQLPLSKALPPGFVLCGITLKLSRAESEALEQQ